MKILLAYDILHVYLGQKGVKNEITYLINLLQKMNINLYVEARSNLMLYLDGLLPAPNSRAVKGSFLLPIRDKEYMSDLDKISFIEYAEKLERYVPSYIYQPTKWKDEKLHLLLVLGYYSSIGYLIDKQVDLIISNDTNLHLEGYKKRKNSKIYRVEQFLERARIDFPSFCVPGKIEIKRTSFDQLDVRSPFFDSYRDEYTEFEDWFIRKSNEKATAYIATIKEEIVGFLVLKEETESEDYADIIPSLPPCKRLKISSFKVAINGYRISELFLNIVFKTALKRRVAEIYVTVHTTYENRRVLIELLCSHWGFKKWGIKGEKERVLIRSFKKGKNESIRNNFPFHQCPNSSMVVNLTNKQVHDYQKGYLRQIYISHNECKQLQPGDVLLFRDVCNSIISFAGEIEEVRTDFANVEDFIAACKKRSLETEESLRNYWIRRNSDLCVIKFLHSYDIQDSDGFLLERRIKELQIAYDKIIPSTILKKLIKETSYEKNIIVD